MTTKTMTPKERYATTMAGGKPDKLPILLGNYNNFITYYYGVTVEQYCNEPALAADLCCRFFQEFGFDQVMPGATYIFYGMGPETGVKWEWVGNNFPAGVDGPIKTKKDLEKFKIPQKPTGYFKNYLEIYRLCKERLGHRLFLSTLIFGPFTCSAYLRGGVEHLILDGHSDPDFYDACMRTGVELSKYLGHHLYALGVDNYLINDVFITPELCKPDFYWKHIAPYNRQVVEHFVAQGKRLSDSFGAFMGKPGDPQSQRDGRHVYNYLFGTKESVETIKVGMKYALPGWPAMCSVSGRMLATWSKDEILGFLKEALGYMVRDQGKYPAISMISVQPPTKEDAPAFAEKLRAIGEFRDKYKL